ncbi:MAG: 50S ribosomal protein L11 methyltransferase [Desulfuromonadales bacterium]|nr:50S ribosomal protein L11 methyltransferase [Desulfuromonadales bacterium]NIS43415.1 50S ribosomal protein L11 methyltransferase [Desulfuromonadales bacterium]
MSDVWVEVRIPVPAEAVDLVCEAMHQIGCDGVTVAQCDLDAFVPPDPDEVLGGDQLIRAYFPLAGDAAALRARVATALGELADHFAGGRPPAIELVEVTNEDWAQEWKQYFTAERFGRRLVVRPSWEAFAAAEGDAVLTLDPGMAFGTGTHGTTRLCLEALVELFDAGATPASVLDVGTGSGILAMACAVLGSRRVLACDIDAGACRVARENVADNDLQALVEITEAPLETLEGRFEAVVANILAEENVRLAPQLVERLAPRGHLILSGILIEKEALVRDGFAPWFGGPPQVRRQGEWSCLIYRKDD